MAGKLFVTNELENLSFNILSTTRCSSNCSGCTLSFIERRNDFLFTRLSKDTLKNNLINYAEGFRKRFELEKINLMSFNFGPGDHMMLKKNEIREIIEFTLPFKSISKVLQSNFSISCITHPTIFQEKLNWFRELEKEYDLNFIFNFILDIEHMGNQSLEKLYKNNVEYLIKFWGSAHMQIAVGEHTFDNWTTAELYRFLKDNKISVVTFGFVPTLDKKENDFLEWKKSLQFISEFYHFTKNKPIEVNCLEHLEQTLILTNSLEEIRESYQQKYLEEITKDYIQQILIDTNGNIGIGFDRIGDVFYYEKTGYNFDINLAKDNYNLDLLEIIEQKIKKHVMKDIIYQSKHCGKCELIQSCILNGSLGYKKTIPQMRNFNNSSCPIGIKEELLSIYNSLQQ